MDASNLIKDLVFIEGMSIICCSYVRHLNSGHRMMRRYQIIDVLGKLVSDVMLGAQHRCSFLSIIKLCVRGKKSATIKPSFSSISINMIGF